MTDRIPTSARVRIAVIGKGRWGKTIIKTLDTLPSCQITHIETRDYKKLLAQNDIDAVVVATPASTHAAVAIPFLHKGIATFIEKPLALSLEDAEKIEAAAQNKKTPVFVGHVHLYSGAYQTLKKLTRQAGTLRVLSGQGLSNGPFRADCSAMWDWVPHDLAMMLDIAEEFPKNVQAWGFSFTRPSSKLYDMAQIKFEFPSGMIGLVTSSTLSPEKRRSFTVIASKHTIVYEATPSSVTFFKNAAPAVKNGKVTERQPIISHPTYDTGLPLTRELEAFIDMVKTGKKSATNLHSGIAIVRILEAADRSIALHGKKIPLPGV